MEENNSLTSFVESDINLQDFFKLISPENNLLLADEVMLTDSEGIVVWISDNYEQSFGFEHGSMIGRSVYDLEKEGIFNPSVSAIVIRDRKKVTMTQTINGDYSNVMTIGIPLFNKKKELKYAACFNTVSMEQINSINKKYREMRQSLDAYAQELDELRTRTTSTSLVLRSKAMQQIWSQMQSVANTKANILITGDTGVGKSAIAKAIHKMSNMQDGPFIEVNCAVLNENLIESELFGYERGAFTGASSQGKIGKIELANHGTLFLDEIGELPPQVQSKLLEVIQEKTIERMSSNKKIEVDFRLIVATNRDLEAEVASGKFRSDLYYRLNVIRMHIPPLKERREDIVPMANAFLSKFSKEYEKSLTFSPRFLTYLEHHTWPGNVRELENLIERLVITTTDPIIDISSLPVDMSSKLPQEKYSTGTLTERVEALEKEIISEAYARLGSTVAVAQELGISQPTAARKIAKYLKNE